MTTDLQLAIAGAFYYGLSFETCDRVFGLAKGEAERSVRQTMRETYYSPKRLDGTKSKPRARGKGGRR